MLKSLLARGRAHPPLPLPWQGGAIPSFKDKSYDGTHEHAKLSITVAPDGVHNTIAWADFAINETQSADIRATFHDSAGGTVTSIYTGIIVQRTS